MNKKERILYTKNCLEILSYKCVTPDDKDFRIYEGVNSVIPKTVDANFNDGFLNNWNWIMEVCEAIEKLHFFFHTLGRGSFVTTTDPKIIELNNWDDTIVSSTDLFDYEKEMPTKKEAVVSAINQFLIWYKNINK